MRSEKPSRAVLTQLTQAKVNNTSTYDLPPGKSTVYLNGAFIAHSNPF